MFKDNYLADASININHKPKQYMSIDAFALASGRVIDKISQEFEEFSVSSFWLGFYQVSAVVHRYQRLVFSLSVAMIH